MNAEIVRRISEDLGLPASRIEATIGLLEGGATIPFVARYRKETTGNLNESRLRELADRYRYHKEFEDRRQFILSKLGSKGKLTEDLRKKIEAAPLRSELEDLYLPYRPRRQSRDRLARHRGLEPLADYIAGQSGPQAPEELAARLVSAENGIPTAELAIAGALDILSERIAADADLRRWLRQLMLAHGVVHARAAKGKEAEKTKYSMYYDFEEPVSRIPSHRVLAVRRGAREGVLVLSVESDARQAREEIRRRLGIRSDCPWAHLLERAADDAYRRLLEPSIEGEVRSFLRTRAESEAIQVFEENLRALLLAPPAGRIPVLGIDPGPRPGSTAAALDPMGGFLEALALPPDEPAGDPEAAGRALLDLIRKHNVRAVAIGNGTGSRESEAFVRSVIGGSGLDVFIAVVNEAGASVYAASKRAREEFPELDAAARGAISIARRLQDPLAELVKIDPKSIGVGQYQHDVDQKKLRASLRSTLESSVNYVGVELNRASADLLKYVSGIQDSLARAIVEHRSARGPFTSREQLREVSGLGEKTFEQAAGFLRIESAECPLDRTSVHPESYPLVERMAASIDVPLSELLDDASRIHAIRFQDFEQDAGRFTLADIRAELLEPGRDPRKPFTVLRFREDIREISDLREGMELEGRVTNVTNFGAFVDIGVHQDGLIHISELSHRYVSDARRAVSVGDLLRVKVVGVDPELRRISLSRKALIPKPRPRPKPARQVLPAPRPAESDTARGPLGPRTREAAVAGGKPGKGKTGNPKERDPATSPPPSMAEQIRRLQEKFRGPGS